MLVALHECLGNVSEACAKVGVGRTTHYGWLQEDAEYKQQVEDISEAEIDFAESKLRERIEGVKVQKGDTSYLLPPDPACIIFYLKTKGKKRGYVERQELVIPEAVTVKFKDAE